MLKVKLATLGASSVAVLAMVPHAFASTYTIDSGDVTAIGSGATDTATSAFGMVGDLLPVLVPLIVFGFGFMLVKRVFPKI